VAARAGAGGGLWRGGGARGGDGGLAEADAALGDELLDLGVVREGELVAEEGVGGEVVGGRGRADGDGGGGLGVARLVAVDLEVLGGCLGYGCGAAGLLTMASRASMS
jgi:hypothetical protein